MTVTVFSVSPQLFFFMAFASFISADTAVIAVKRLGGLKLDRFAEIVKILFAAYIILAASLTLFPVRYLVTSEDPVFSAVDINLVPTATIKKVIGLFGIAQLPLIYKLRSFFFNIIGNLLLLMPLGFLAPFLSRRFKSPLAVLSLSLAVSCLIELIQFIESSFGFTTGRVTDIDDVILNVIGAAVGMLLLKKVRRTLRRG